MIQKSNLKECLYSTLRNTDVPYLNLVGQLNFGNNKRRIEGNFKLIIDYRFGFNLLMHL